MIEVVAAIIKVEDKYLCCQRKKNKFNYLSEKYEFPGGKVENNETMEEALRREIKEELDLNISIDRFFKTINYSYPDFDIKMHVFICSLQHFNITLNEHLSYKLLELKELNLINWVPADMELIKSLQANNGF